MASSTTTQQYQATQKGGPFTLASIPQPIPEANEVSIRLKTIGLNPLDWKQLYFGAMVASWPAMFGMDGAGIVEDVGEGVTKFKKGDEVFSLFGGSAKAASFQEVPVVPESFVAKKPANVGWEEAASLPICYVAAASAIYASLRIPLLFLPSGSTTGPTPASILVLGGSSGVGASAIQILRLALPASSSTTILTTASPHHHTRLTTSLGATKAFNHTSPTLITDIKSATRDGKGVDMIIDCVAGGAARTDIFDTFAADGPKEYAEVVTGAQFSVPEGVKRHLVFGRKVFATQGGGDVMPALAELVGKGEYKIPFEEVRSVGSGWEAIDKGLVELKKGVSGVKLVVAV